MEPLKIGLHNFIPEGKALHANVKETSEYKFFLNILN
jgi:hypothetical protein